MIILFLAFNVFADPITNWKCNGDMNTTWAIKPQGASCIEVPIENGKHKDLTDYKIQGNSFVIDQQKRDARLAAEAQKEAERQAKEAEKQAMKDIAKKSNMSKAEQDQLLKYLLEKLNAE